MQIIMKKFDINKAKQGDDICTANGQQAKILLFDRCSIKFPLVVILNNKRVYYYTVDGKFYYDKESELDLKML